jgi:mannose/fructose/N-acetylgalactosamine-specific phosphotransferase system component IID
MFVHRHESEPPAPKPDPYSWTTLLPILAQIHTWLSSPCHLPTLILKILYLWTQMLKMRLTVVQVGFLGVAMREHLLRPLLELLLRSIVVLLGIPSACLEFVGNGRPNY